MCEQLACSKEFGFRVHLLLVGPERVDMYVYICIYTYPPFQGLYWAPHSLIPY